MILLSDLHLSPTHGFFWENWRIARDATNEAAPDLVVIAGDLCIDGPDSDAEIAFARRAIGGLHGRVHALPGNHDVGDEPPGQDPDQLVDAPRLARWGAAFGADRFAIDCGAWRLIGLNSLLLGSGLPEEAAQGAWLDAALADAGDRPAALILHKPLYLRDPLEAPANATTVTPAPRAALLRQLEDTPVRMIVSGHLHVHRDLVLDGRRHVWAPALAFVNGPLAGGAPVIGLLAFDFSTEDAQVELLRPDGLVAHNLAEIKQHGRWKFLRDMPPSPPPEV